MDLAAELAEAAIDELLGPEAPLSEPAVARTIARHLPAEAELVVASSMPVRDLEWYGGPTARAHANRGANGIDGVVSTALGVALRGVPTVALVGDVAFVHDAGALTALARRPHADLRIVVVDNDGGGIFSFLPQATVLPAARFEALLGTPHGTDLLALGRAHGLDARTVTTAADLVERISTPGPSVTRVATDRAGNVAVHAALDAAVAAALDGVRIRVSAAGHTRTKHSDDHDPRESGSRPDQRRQHRLELGLGLGELGQRVAVGDDAATGVEAGPVAGGVELGTADHDRPGPVAGSVEPADRAP